uniref:Hemocyanin subunit 3c n=1 Tax=Pandinus imperator TaxID=55084 RepID=C6H0Z7_PANIM|nr:hemocyanin subunit 3c [Pandinus imperator]
MSTKDLEKRILPLFEFAPLETKEKFSLFAERTGKHLGILGRGQLFSCFHRDHLQEATEFYEMLIGAETFDEFLDLCHQARDFLNEGLYVYAVSVAILHRDDCRGITLPPIQEIFPEKFVNVETLNSAHSKVYDVHAEKGKDDIIVDWVMPFEHGEVQDPESRLFYYREDIDLNAHHWHWHLVYPATWNAAVTGKKKNRKGELFYYMHQQMCARYDCERLSNDLPRMIPFHNFDEPLDGYSPHLFSCINGLPYASRPSGLTLRDMKEVSVLDLERWRDRILSAIHLGHVTKETGEEITLTETFGIDVLGDIVESSHDSVNKNFYGSLHNWGHVMMAAIQDPKGKYQTNPGVMSDTATSLRDPIFYRWHRFIDNLFQEYKNAQHPYDIDHLGFTGIEIKSVAVETDGHRLHDVHTSFATSILNISSAYPLDVEVPIKVRWPHLTHEPFTYNISVVNHTGRDKLGTVRIFLAPVHDELGNVLNPDQLRRLMIELDKFQVDLHPGSNAIKRKSVDSSVTLSYETTFEKLLRGELVDARPTEYCSCGWPEHLLLPKGNEKGMEFHLFVMLTDWLDDVVGESRKEGICVDAVSYCGARDDLYPDRRAMGFPFDRRIEADTVEEWLLPNMSDTIIKITHVKDHE